MSAPPRDLTLPQSAVYLSLSESSLRRAVRAGKLRPFIDYEFGGKRFPVATLDQYRRERTVEAALPAAKHWSGFTPAMAEAARQRVDSRRAERSSCGPTR